jgi:general secretion pathway protein E/type IV pilus assembly protein PilB
VHPNEDYILEILINSGLIEASDAEEVKAAAMGNGHGPVEELIRRGIVTELDVLRAMANESGLSMLPKIEHVSDDAVASLDRAYVMRYKVMPLERDDRTLRLAISNPHDFETIDTLQGLINLDIESVVVPEDEILSAIKRFYGSIESAVGTLTGGYKGPELELRTSGDAPEEGATSKEEAPIIKMVHLMIIEAHRMRASDIHLEPMEKRLRLRYRIDGVLQVMQDPPKKLQSSIIARIKIMSNMSIAEKRLPQDGRIQLRTGERQTIDLRVSTVPTVHGESIVMRILDKSSLLLGLPELGFLSDDQVVMESILGMSDGIFLVTGPTGSGKTTTLYACLNYINKPDRKIITVEEPVEYQLGGINQVPVNHDVGMTFAAALRAMLRQAPNIIMIGEIRDLETASIAVNASLTGHLVFSTLHTNDAPSAITRLVDIGVKPFLVASSIRAIMAQRLLRRICPNCAEPYMPTEDEIRALNLDANQLASANFQQGHGCDRCRGTGFKGRMGIFEIFKVDDEIRRMVNEKMGVSAIRRRARDLGMRTLREDGVRKVLTGMTTPEEVITATMGDKE